MNGKSITSDSPAGLRRRAEAHLSNQGKGQRSKAGDHKSGASTERVLHELQVHQIELEMQNTELREARDRMEVLLEKYSDLYDFAPVGYLSLDEAGVILEANLTGAALLGCERSRLINRRLPLLVSPTSRPDFLAFLHRVFSGTGKQVCEAMLIREDGDPFWGELNGTVAITLDGPKKWCRVAISDISVLKHAEETQRRLAAIVESSEDAIISKDLNGIVSSWNKGAEKTYGYSASEMVGTPILRLIPPNRFAEEKLILSKIRRGESVQHFETLRQTKQGRLINVSITISPIRDASGQIIGASKVARDITERKQAETARRRLEVMAASNRKLEVEIVRRRRVEESLKQSQQDQSRLLDLSQHMQEQLRNLSRQILLAQEAERKRISRELHDVIAQTLTGINVHLAGLKITATINPKSLAENISRTQRLVEHSVKIIHQFARELRPAVLDDLGLIPALNTFMKHFQAETGLRVSLSAEVVAAQVQGDKRTVLFRVAQEALTNIARHAKASRAAVKLQKLDRNICMTITDNGKGFQQKLLLQKGKKQRLGLLGMRERVEMVSGNFTVQSTPGKGTTVRVQIPLADAGGGRKTR